MSTLRPQLRPVDPLEQAPAAPPWELPEYLVPNRDLNFMLAFAAQQGASDINIQSGRPVMVDIDGRLSALFPRPLSGAEVGEVLIHMYGEQNALVELRSGKDIDDAYELRAEDGTWYRFRYNATACYARSYDSALQLTLRTLPDTPPTLEQMALPERLAKALLPPEGMVLVTGATGSGKSTLLAALCRAYLSGPVGRKIITYESPIEFVYEGCDNPSGSMVSQSAVPMHLRSFEACVRNAMRRKPDVILLGEARDSPTIQALVEAAMTGHVCYATLHAANVAVSLRRMLACAGDAVTGPDIIENVRVIISQRLLANPKGGRTAVRDALVFTEDLREALIRAPADRLTAVAHELVREHGWPMIDDIRQKYEAGLIHHQDMVVAEMDAAKGGAPGGLIDV